ncbi:GL21737 [Drosophila persimilis]|uniref:GL21737 n=1 Tax=Drosophila persimilis TaxID=7234 RepID=B4GET6_DROPE|nr:GL21737 [Drosophila persimilis]
MAESLNPDIEDGDEELSINQGISVASLAISSSSTATTTNSSISSSSPSSYATSSFISQPDNVSVSSLGVLVLQTAKKASESGAASTAVATWTSATTTAAAAPTETATTLSSNSIWKPATARAATSSTRNPRNAREAERQRRQNQQDTEQQQQQQQEQHRRQPHPDEGQEEQQQHNQQQQPKAQRVGVLIPPSLHTDMMHVQQGFHNFLDFFQLHFSNVSVDFLRDVDTDVDLNLNLNQNGSSGNSSANVDIDPAKRQLPRQQHQQEPQKQQHQQEAKVNQSSAGDWNERNHWNDARSLGHCHQLAEQLAHDYNKTIVLWPCPRMKPQLSASSIFAAKSTPGSTFSHFLRRDFQAGDSWQLAGQKHSLDGDLLRKNLLGWLEGREKALR